ncbi:SanA/YdcF family protein [Maribacter sp. CXY002]|uniref:SanA/YdcF family protein n=1 Tax=Maribacter luteocoastalis TaxID=3407671 RepID=UPI003B675174
MKIQKKIVKIILALFVGLLLVLIICNYLINSFAQGRTYSTLSEIQKNKVGLVLGTSKKLKNGQANPYYDNRIKATVKLFTANKIEFILVSGDNGSIYYNEPSTIKKDLVAEGIPAERIFLDYAGFRTLDSMVRAKEVFGLNELTVISQKFHNERAIYIANHKGLNAIGFNAEDISLKAGMQVQLREYFARVKVFLDMALRTQPKFYGDKIKIE